MSNDTTWDDTARDELRASLRDLVRGEVRLGRSDREDIIRSCQEVHVEDVCPQNEWGDFIRYATDELELAVAAHVAEQKAWPRETDCDRLDRVEADLRNRGILLWQLSPCCDTCTGSELPDRIDEIEARHPGFRDDVRGYTFFIDQNMAEMLSEDTLLTVYLAYGWFSPDNSDVGPDIYKHSALDVAKEVCDCLRERGFKPDWDGDFSKKIGVSLNWQRRTMLP